MRRWLFDFLRRARTHQTPSPPLPDSDGHLSASHKLRHDVIDQQLQNITSRLDLLEMEAQTDVGFSEYDARINNAFGHNH